MRPIFLKIMMLTVIAVFMPLAAYADETRTAIFAGGCFWSMEHAFEGTDGIKSLRAGFAGGTAVNPTYEQVSAGGTGHREAVEVTYDPAKITYQRLLDVYWRNTDPFDAEGQFCDKGEQYKPAIFAGSDAEKQAAETEKAALAKRFKKPVATAILPAATFYPAEDYHQHYADKHPIAYGAYRTGCGRDPAMRAIWGSEAGADAFRKAPQ